MIQDTSFIVDFLRGDPDADALLDVVEKESRPQKVSTVTVLELYEGVARASVPERKRTEIIVVLGLQHVDADHEVMRRAGEISSQLTTDGQ
jgi:predicted nucleic acid-binding protein